MSVSSSVTKSSSASSSPALPALPAPPVRHQKTRRTGQRIFLSKLQHQGGPHRVHTLEKPALYFLNHILTRLEIRNYRWPQSRIILVVQHHGFIGDEVTSVPGLTGNFPDVQVLLTLPGVETGIMRGRQDPLEETRCSGWVDHKRYFDTRGKEEIQNLFIAVAVEKLLKDDPRYIIDLDSVKRDAAEVTGVIFGLAENRNRGWRNKAVEILLNQGLVFDPPCSDMKDRGGLRGGLGLVRELHPLGERRLASEEDDGSKICVFLDRN